MYFWRRASYVEPLFEADSAAAEASPGNTPTSTEVPPLRSSSTSSSSGSSSFLAQDPMHTSHIVVSTSLADETATTAVSDEEVNVPLSIGDVVFDDEGAEWIVRNCFWDSSHCNGRSLKRIDGKDELDVWDKGRPQSQ